MSKTKICELCQGAFDKTADPEGKGRPLACPWCLNPIEYDEDEDEYVERPPFDELVTVYRAERPQDFYIPRTEAPDGFGDVHAFLTERGTWINTPDDGRPLTPIQAHRLARWIMGNVPLADGEMP